MTGIVSPPQSAPTTNSGRVPDLGEQGERKRIVLYCEKFQRPIRISFDTIGWVCLNRGKGGVVRYPALSVMVGCLTFGAACLADEPAAEPATNRPVAWAQPIPLAGVPNLHKVSATLYRSAQPTAEGMANLKKLGIRTVLDLRSFHSDKDELASTGLASESISMKTWHPEEEDVIRFLKIVSDPAKAPVLMHCRHGADRTGMLCAIYRIVIQGWTREDALREMTEGGFNFHELWVNLVPYIQKLDFDRLRKEAGLDKTEPIQPTKSS